MPPLLQSLVIVNPLSGGGRKPARAERCLREMGLAREVVHRDNLPGVREMARRAVAEGARLIIACGGDGTINAAVNALAGTDCALAALPCGVGNDIVRSLGLPPQVERACRLLPSLEPTPIDLVRVNGDGYYVGVGSLGVAAHMAAWVRRRKGAGPWWALYAASFGRALVDAPAPWLEVRAGPYAFRGEAALAAFANGRLLGRWFPVAPRADMADGLIDVCLVAAGGRRRLLRLLAAVPLERHVGCRAPSLPGRRGCGSAHQGPWSSGPTASCWGRRR